MHVGDAEQDSGTLPPVPPGDPGNPGNPEEMVDGYTDTPPVVEDDTGGDRSLDLDDANSPNEQCPRPIIEDQTSTPDPIDVVMHDETNESDADLLLRIGRFYRLLDLINEQGSGGAVDKVIIAQESVAKLVNDICPGAYTSMTKVDFNALDTRDLKPIGVYGSTSAIVDFLQKAECIDEETALLLLAPPRPANAAQQQGLRPGLYLLNASHVQPGLVYIIFWPEETTWDDNAAGVVSRNRTTFMRFLTKLCDQVVALISDQHSEKLVFKSDAEQVDVEFGDFDAADDSDRLFDFEVRQSGQQEDSATAGEGFKLSHPCMTEVKACPENFDLERLQPIFVAGDIFKAVLSAECIPEQYKKAPIGSLFILGFRDVLKTSGSPRLILDESIDFSSLKILLNYGLNQRCSGVYQSWRAEKHKGDDLIKRRERDATAAGKGQIEAALVRIKNGIMKWLAEQAVAKYPSLTEDVVVANISDSPEQGIPVDDLRYLQTTEVSVLLANTLRQIDDDPKSRFCTLKRRFRRHYELLQTEKGFDNETVQRMINILGTHGDYEKELTQVTEGNTDGSRSDQPGILSILFSFGLIRSRPRSDKPSRATLKGYKLAEKDDTTFLTEICTIIKEEPAYQQVVEEIVQEATISLSTKLKKLEKELLQLVRTEAIRITRTRIDEQVKAERQDADLAAQAELRALIRKALDAEADHPTNRARVIIRNVSMDKSSYQDSYRVDGETIIPLEAGVCYKFNILEVKKQDTLESDYVPQPFIRRAQPPSFTLPPSHHICFVRPIGNDRCLLVVQDPQGVLNVYLDTVYGLGTAVKSTPKKIFHSQKLGPNPLFALDEAKRILVIYASDEKHAQIIPYVYENSSNVLNARGGAINVTRWFDGPRIPRMLHGTFISGSEELLLVDETGLARIFSLVTEQFRPAVCELGYVPASIHTVPDGAAFLALEPRSDGTPRLLCYHLASFGPSAATTIELPEGSYLNANMAVSCMGQNENPHAIFLDCSTSVCSSISLHIASKTSEYDFRAGGNRSDSVEKHTIHNSLIDCQSDVWTRYPVQAAIRRETVPGTKHCPRSFTFISSHSPDSFSKYFKALVRDFESKTRKPTRRQLADVSVAVRSSFDLASPNISTSQFKAGDWLVGLFCLIPIHIAVTGQNRFVPLCDGVISQEFEQSLLGADVGRIAEALSFGWYESIFASYLARKPVKVVTSMGEQSVGKSYALNHFVDTSFAGSAMRCTEGVWLSVTPTQDALIVSMDFEGVNSIERSAQEDTLLVLFNAAISNLVLFRNNFALSRDIASSFKSFQSSTKVFDPAANPSLFQSTLAIIIKDVIDSDTKEIVNEFSLKFKHIVRNEAGDNFISKLHRGKLAIIPWPVIQSTRFYELFGALKTRLEKQPVTHKSAGEFLRVLKMLMAKLKACDWGALDQNLAAQRVQHLTPYVVPALAFGCLDPETRFEPLKNMDTDQTILGPSSEIVFYLSDTKAPITSETCLALLRSKWEGRHDRFKTSEGEFLASFNQYLLSIAEARIGQVRTWLEQNTARFVQHADVRTLFRRFDELAKELKSHILLCGAACGSCSLSCLKERQHDDGHDCYTSHKCPRACEFNDEHEGLPAPACDMPAGHNGRHICGEMPHQCGQLCALDSREGCLQKCCKPTDHDDDEGHMCAARTHACGAPCSLQVDGKPLCTRKCIADCHEEHERHCCALALACPVKCRFCNSFCSAPNHFHALEATAVHLCGQEHPCPQPCQTLGVCHVDTTPHSIESTFIGRHERFQYTKFTQEARRLPCVVPIPPDQLKHSGPHVHSTAADAFHFCNARCGYCEYYCTLPLGHSQREHATSHGSMSNTVWFVHGENNTTVEVEGRRYAAGDSGAPMLCSLVCKSLGRHIHVDTCRSADDDGVCGGGPGIQHINDPDSNEKEDLISHRVFWGRSGFSDPYSQQEQAEFDLCDHKCGGTEHDDTLNSGAAPSYCTLPLFHAPAQQGQVTFSSINGHISGNGHAFPCKNPAQMQRAFHIIFVVDISGSMFLTDHRPLANTPMTRRISSEQDNRYGAVLSSLYAFWSSRQVVTRNGVTTGVRQDSYSIVLFDHNSEVLIEGNTTSTPEELVDSLIERRNDYGGTNFDGAIRTATTVLESQWDPQRTPVVVFLSDGECRFEDEVVYDLCRSAVRAGSALSFHAVSFGSEAQAGSLHRMVQIATEIHDAAPRDPLMPLGIPCSYSEALDTVQLANTFLAIADSLHNPRATLRRL